MSKRKNPQTRMRGPSRPIDPRYAPGRPARRGPDNFGLGLIAVSMAVAIVIILFIAGQRGSSTVAPVAPSTDASASATQSAVAFYEQATTVQTITPQEALALHTANNAKFIDVRVNTEYVKQHIKGAVNIPNTEVEKRHTEIPKEGNVILYCQ